MTFASIAGSTVPTGKGQIRVQEYVYAPEPLRADTSAVSPHQEVSNAEDPIPSNGYEEVFALEGAMPDGYVLGQPVSVRVTFEGTEYVAEQPRLDVHAFGDSAIEAVLNLRERVVEHYRRLEEAGDHLSPRLKHQRQLLRGLLQRQDA